MRTLSILLASAFFAPILVSADLPKGTPQQIDERFNWKASPEGLKEARLHPWSQMFLEQATTKGDPHATLVISSALGEDGQPYTEMMKSSKAYIILANPDVDDFTRQGGLYWRQGKTSGTVKFKQAGALIMIVRQADGTVNWFTLHTDFRC